MLLIDIKLFFGTAQGETLPVEMCAEGLMTGPTTDHAAIREWARTHNAMPAMLHEHVFDSEPARLRFVFGQIGEEAKQEVQPISWEQFFALFELLGLALAFGGGQQYEILELEKEPRPQFKEVRH